MRVGIIGAGSMGRIHLHGWSATEAHLVGIFSKTYADARASAETFRITAYKSIDALLDAVDIVDICTPTHTHSALAIRAAQAGKHILCEKPIARTLAEGRAMIQACAEHSVRMMVAHVLRFFPAYRLAHRRIAAGECGAPAVLRLYRHAFAPPGGKDNWFLRKECSGGVILDLMLHDIDFLLWVAGAVEAVYAAYATGDASSANAKEHALAMVRHTSGAISHLEGSWAFPPPTFRMGFEIACKDILLEYDSQRSAPIHIHRHASNAKHSSVPRPADCAPYAAEISAFYDAIKQEKPFPMEAQEALSALQVALALMAAAESGAVQTIPAMEIA